jgi:hypothetical protein
MKKFSRLPHEQVTADGDGGFGPEHDGLPVDGDVEGHIMGHTKGERLAPGMPGTGGDQIAVDIDAEDDRT